MFDTPTGRKASVEDVVVNPECSGQHIGRKLMERKPPIKDDLII